MPVMLVCQCPVCWYHGCLPCNCMSLMPSASLPTLACHVICMDSWSAGFARMWQRQKGKGHQMTGSHSRQGAYAWNLKMPHNRGKSHPVHQGIRYFQVTDPFSAFPLSEEVAGNRSCVSGSCLSAMVFDSS